MGKSTDTLNQMIRDSQVVGKRFGKMLLGPQYQTEEGFLITREKERNDSNNVSEQETDRKSARSPMSTIPIEAGFSTDFLVESI